MQADREPSVSVSSANVDGQETNPLTALETQLEPGVLQSSSFYFLVPKSSYI